MLDPRFRIPKLPKETIIFASCGNFVGHFNDECFVITDGDTTRPNATAAAKLAGETALWAYRQVRLRKGYWLDKQLLVRRIFRSTNLTIWQKKREPGFEEGLATSLLVAIVGHMGLWIGSVGDASAWIFHEGQVSRLTREDCDNQGTLTRALGYQRLGLLPHISRQNFVSGDLLLLATHSITSVLSATELTKLIEHTGNTQGELHNVAEDMVQKARKAGGQDGLAVCLIKRTAFFRYD